MSNYPKQVLDTAQQLQTYIDGGMTITSMDEARSALENIGYYRLRGYCHHLYDNNTKKYRSGTSFSDILSLYHFDTEFSHLLFSMSASIEVSLRVRLAEALLINGDPLAIFDPAYFSDKGYYWKNNGVLCGEIGRSNDVFIKHNFDNHDGLIPVWAAVEVMSFGNLSMTIKNLRSGVGSPAALLLSHYKYKSTKGNDVTPSLQMFSSWTQAVSVLRNMCAHNSRIYNRAINTYLKIPAIDVPQNPTKYNGAYQLILAMKYLRPSDAMWNQFLGDLNVLFQKYSGVIEMKRINFPTDWSNHLTV
ncbi:MAG: Abi family protein [Lachnospiraceae bacterium]|nr:Abi family protein [Lachnospiraceae bacterium]